MTRMYSTAFKTLAILVVVTIQIHFTATKHQDEILYGFKYGDGEDSSAFTIDLPKGWAPWVKYIQLVQLNRAYWEEDLEKLLKVIKPFCDDSHFLVSSDTHFKRRSESCTISIPKHRFGRTQTAFSFGKRECIGTVQVNRIGIITNYCSQIQIFLKQTLLEKAESSFLHAIEIAAEDGGSHIAQFSLGITYSRMGKFAEAVQTHQNALHVNHSFIPAMFHLGSLFFIQGDINQGIYWYSICVERLEEQFDIVANSTLPESDELTLQRDMKRYLLNIFQSDPSMHKEVDQLASTLKAFVENFHHLDISELHLRLGLNLMNIGAYDQGLLHLEESIGMRPSNEWVRFMLKCALPVVYYSKNDILAHRITVARVVREALQSGTSIGQPEDMQELYFTLYSLPYAGLFSHLLIQDISTLFSAASQPPIAIVAGRLNRLRYSCFLAPEGTINATIDKCHELQLFSSSSNQSYIAMANTVPPVFEKLMKPVDPTAWVHYKYPLLATKQSSASPSAIVRLGIVTYQLFDSNVGHTLYRLIEHLTTYHTHSPKDNVKPPEDAVSRMMESIVSSLGSTNDRDASPQTPIRRKIQGVKRFRVVLFVLRPLQNKFGSWIVNLADEVVPLPWSPNQKRRNVTMLQDTMSKANLDVLLATDSGIDSYLYATLHGRMAPVQMVYWGDGASHTMSLGMPDTVDYYITGDDVSPANLQDVMCEQIVRIAGLGTFFMSLPPVTPAEHLERVTNLHLLANSNHYLIPRVTIAIHPEFDQVILGILRRDHVASIIILHEADQVLWVEKLRKRWKSNSGFSEEDILRVRMVPMMSRRQFLALMVSSCVIIDTFPVGMGISSLEALSLGTPLVTYPHKQTSSRHFAAGALRSMNLTSLIVSNIDECSRTSTFVARSLFHRGRYKLLLLKRIGLLQWRTARPNAMPYDMDKLTMDIESSLPTEEEKLRFREVIQEDQRETDELYRLSKESGEIGERTLNDFAQLIGRTGHPWALLRKANDAETKSLQRRQRRSSK